MLRMHIGKPGCCAPPSVLNTQNNSIDLRLNDSVAWKRGGFAAVIGINYSGSYRDTEVQPTRRIGFWLTTDLHLSYTFPVAPESWLACTRIEFDGQNLFNVTPPFLDNAAVGLGYDQENADPYGRIISLQARKTW